MSASGIMNAIEIPDRTVTKKRIRLPEQKQKLLWACLGDMKQLSKDRCLSCTFAYDSEMKKQRGLDMIVWKIFQCDKNRCLMCCGDCSKCKEYIENKYKSLENANLGDPDNDDNNFGGVENHYVGDDNYFDCDD